MGGILQAKRVYNMNSNYLITAITGPKDQFWVDRVAKNNIKLYNFLFQLFETKVL